jgi:hypothetical protein
MKEKNSYREGSFKINTFLAMKWKLWYKSQERQPRQRRESLGNRSI